MKDIHEDFRCPCGKLLLRGLILSGTIEIKCRFCKKIQTLDGHSDGKQSSEKYLFTANRDGKISKMSKNAPKILGHSNEHLLGSYVEDIVVMLSPNFYSQLWSSVVELSEGKVVFESLQRSADSSLSPVSIETQKVRLQNEPHIIFQVERKKTLKSLFSAGGTIS